MEKLKTLTYKNMIILIWSVTPIITPRFAVGVTMALMKKLGDLARKYNLPVQTHIDENIGEIEFIKVLFPNSSSYADVYREAGLFNVKNMILGHCVYMTDDEIEMIVNASGVGCSHCPISNFALDSGLAPMRKYLDADMTLGLGTDVSGGYSSSMLDSMRGAILASKALFFVNNRTEEFKAFEYHSALWLGTKGSANLLGLGDEIGTLAPGYQFDAIEVDILARNSPMAMSVNIDNGRYGPVLTTEEKVSKFIYEGDDRNIVRVWVNGRKIKDTRIFA